MNQEQKKKLVKNFYQMVKSLIDEKDVDHIVFEFALLLFGNKKMFDTVCLLFEKKSIRKEVFLWVTENFKNEKDFHVEIDDNVLSLIRKKSLPIFYAYKKAELFSIEQQRLYGLLMGFPKSATDAWYLDIDKENGHRVQLLNSYEIAILHKALGDIFLWGFVYSRKNWQSEYRFQLKEHIYIYELFPEIFLKILQKNQEIKKQYDFSKLHLKKGNLLTKFSPLERFLFEKIQLEKNGSLKTKHNIIYEFINLCRDK